jgi:hypothetical protein
MSRRAFIVAGTVAAVVLAAVVVAVVVVVRRGPGAPPPLEVRRDGLPAFPARGPAIGDDALVQRAARAWQDRDTAAPPSPVPRAKDERPALLWAGPRSGGTLVVLARPAPDQRLRIAYYVERAGVGAVVREDQVRDSTQEPLRLDATGWLLPARGEQRAFRLLRREPYANEPVTTRHGVLEAATPALVLTAEPGIDSYLLRAGGGATVLLNKRSAERTLALLEDEAGARRLFDAAVVAPDSDTTALELTWRGGVPGMGSDAVVVRGFAEGSIWYGIGFGDGAARRFTGGVATARPSPRTSNCGPLPKCAEPVRAELPMLLAGWMYRGQRSPQALVIVADPQIVRIHVRAGTVSRDLPPGPIALTAADLGLPAVPEDGRGGEGPAVVVYGETADGTVVPALD